MIKETGSCENLSDMADVIKVTYFFATGTDKLKKVLIHMVKTYLLAVFRANMGLSC